MLITNLQDWTNALDPITKEEVKNEEEAYRKLYSQLGQRPPQAGSFVAMGMGQLDAPTVLSGIGISQQISRPRG